MKQRLLLSAAAVVLMGTAGATTLSRAEILPLRFAQGQDEKKDSLPDHFGIGRAATAAELARIDDDVRADGRGLPAGSGTPAAGATVYAAKCVACHGKNGEGIRQGTLQLGPKLIGRNPGDAFDFNQSTQKEAAKTIGNYWPYATTLFDYVRRAMPQDRPGSLTDDEVYALTAYLLERNQIIPAAAVIDARSLPEVRMPSRDKFVRDDRETSTKVR
jgi:mono/diheme cytochrome c family protein